MVDPPAGFDYVSEAKKISTHSLYILEQLKRYKSSTFFNL